MSDTSIRSPVTSSVEPEIKSSNTTSSITNVEVPYTDYEHTNGQPYSVTHFELGDTWANPEGGFPKEISLIEEYISNKINSGELPNSVDSIKELFKKIEKTTNIDKNERPLVKVETMAAYVEFLMKTDKIKFNLRRYGRQN